MCVVAFVANFMDDAENCMLKMARFMEDAANCMLQIQCFMENAASHILIVAHLHSFQHDFI